MNLAFKISAGVTGQQAVDQLKTSLDKVHDSAALVGKGTLSLANNFGQLANPLSAATGLLTRFSGALGVAGAVAGLTAIVKSAFDAGDELNKMSQRTGVAVETLSTFKLAAKLSDVSLEDLGKALVKFDVATSKATTGSKELQASFKAVGLSLADLKNLSTEEKILKTSDAFSNMADGADKTRIAVDIFGKAGANMIPMLNMGSEAIEKLGVKMSAEFAARAEAFNDSITLMGEKTKIFTATAVGPLLPTLQEIMNALLKTASTKPDMVSFFDAVGEAARLLAVAVNTVWTGLVHLADAAITGTKQLKSLLTGDFAAIDRLGGEFTQRVKQRAFDMVEFNKSLLKNSLLFGDGTVDEIKKRQSTETMPTLRKGGVKPDTSGLGDDGNAYRNALNALGEEAAKFKYLSENVERYQDRISSAKAAQMEFDVTGGKFKDLTKAQKDELLKAAQAVDQYSASLKDQLSALDYEKATKNIRAETRALGDSALEKQKIIALQDLENRGIKEGTELYERLKKSRFEALQAQYDESRSLSTGVKAALTDYADMATNTAKQVQNALTGAFKGAEEALVNFAMTGKLNFRDFANSIIKDLIRIAIQSQVLGPLAKGIGSWFGGSGFFGGGSAATTAGGTSLIGDFSSVAAFAADGKVFQGGKVTAFASGGVVTSPTLFPMAGGAGLMGEAGPEAVMPLKRGKDGKLGVASSGGAGTTNINVTVAADGSIASSGDSGDGRRLGQAIAAAIRQELVQQKRPGGLLSPV